MFTIKNLYINRSSQDYVGLFGYIAKPAKIGKINITNSTITGKQNVGGLTGYLSGGKINVINIEDVTINGSTQVGGIAGYSTSVSTITEAIVRATIIGSGKHVGGAIGYAFGANNKTSYVTINGILVDSTISGTTNIGGIFGYNSEYNYVEGIVVGGSITATNGKAGLVASGTEYNGLVYVNKDIEINRKTEGYDGAKYDIGYRNMPMYDDVLDTFIGGDNNSTGYYFDYENDTSNKIVLKSDTLLPDTIPLTGSGEEDDPYILKTEQDFKMATLKLNSLKYFKISEDVDISTFNHFYGLGTYNNPFQGYLDGNNKKITKMYLNGGNYSGFIGYMNEGSISNINLEESEVINRHTTPSSGILLGNGAKVVISNVSLEKVKVDASNGSSYVGIMAGKITGTLNKISLHNASNLTGGAYVGGLVGYYTPVTGMKVNISNLDIDLSGIEITGTGDYVGGLIGSYYYGSTTKIINSNIVLNNIKVRGKNYVGGVIGENRGEITGLNLNNIDVSGKKYVGGLIGSNSGKIIGINLTNINVSGTSYVGGLTGQAYNCDIYEVTVRGTVTGTSSNVGGAIGTGGMSLAGASNYRFANLYSILVNADVTGYSNVGGIMGHIVAANIYGVIEGGNITATNGSIGKIIGDNNGYRSTIDSYASNYVAISGETTIDVGTSSGYNIGNLAYYGGIKYNTNSPLLESDITGDLNNTGYYFDNNSDGDIIVVPVGGSVFQPPEIEDDCSNCVQDNETLRKQIVVDTNDTEPPTCVIYYIVPVENGIRVNFSCTDDQSVPKVRSEFNAVRPTNPKDFEDFAGTYKIGSVDGYTRTVTATWDTNNIISIPSKSECYYYRYAAMDDAGNWSSYVTNDCYCGFDNSCK